MNGAYVAILSRRCFGSRTGLNNCSITSRTLVIVNYGTNESVYVVHSIRSTSARFARPARIRICVAKLRFRSMSSMDRGERDASGNIESTGSRATRHAEQRSADELGRAFFNTYEAMGGAGTMGRWYSAEPRLDKRGLHHPTPGGARMVGNLLYRGPMNGYLRYKMRLHENKVAAAQVKQGGEVN